MFQYFYLIPLLLCLKSVFSYEYLDGVPGRTFRNIGKNGRKGSSSDKLQNGRNLLRQEYAYDKNPVEFDVAGFIRPDEEAVADDEAEIHRNQKGRRISKHDDDYNSLSKLNYDEGNSRDVNQDYVGLGDSNLNPGLMERGSPLAKDSMNSKHIKMNAVDDLNTDYGNENMKKLKKNQIVLPEQNLVHNPQKKCVLKNIKLPFFPHYNKTKSLKPKKTTKRKLFSFNHPKKNIIEKAEQNSKQVTPSLQEKKSKRSNEENMCPVCRKKFVSFTSKDKRKDSWKKTLHNKLISEQHVDERENNFKEGAIKPTPYSEHFREEDGEEIRRNKREDPGTVMRRELDVIQQMIEHDDGHVIAHTKSAPNPE